MLPPEYTELLTDGLKLFAGVGLMYGSVKAGLNGAKADIKEIKSDVKDAVKILNEHSIDIAVLQAKRNQHRHGDSTVDNISGL